MAEQQVQVIEQRVVQGIAWMVLTGLLFAAVTGVVRHLGSDLPAVEAAFIRYLIGLLMVAPVLVRLAKNRPSSVALKLYVWRGLVHGIGVICWFYAMARIPIAQVTAIGYITPILVAAGAAVFLGERMQLRRISGILLGFLGVLIIIRPGFEEVNLGQLAQLTAAPLFALSYLLAKKLTDTEDSMAIVGMLSIFCTLTLLPGALLQWRNPTVEEVMWLTLVAFLATSGHYTLTKAFQAAPIMVTQPVGYLQIVWAAAIGVILFAEALDFYTLLGAGVIVGAATYISHREAKAARESAKGSGDRVAGSQITPQADATKV